MARGGPRYYGLSDQDRVARWRADSAIIRDQLIRLEQETNIYRGWFSAIKSNPLLETIDPTFFDWIRRNYAKSAAMTIRTVVDSGTDAQSLKSLLLDMRAHVHLLSAETFAELLDIPDGEKEEWIQGYSGAWPANLGGQDPSENPTVARLCIQEWLDRLMGSSDSVVGFATRRVAHRLDGAGDDVTYDQVVSSCEEVARIGHAVGTLLTTIVVVEELDDCWTDVFRIPWLPPEQD